MENKHCDWETGVENTNPDTDNSGEMAPLKQEHKDNNRPQVAETQPHNKEMSSLKQENKDSNKPQVAETQPNNKEIAPAEQENKDTNEPQVTEAQPNNKEMAPWEQKNKETGGDKHETAETQPHNREMTPLNQENQNFNEHKDAASQLNKQDDTAWTTITKEGNTINDNQHVRGIILYKDNKTILDKQCTSINKTTLQQQGYTDAVTNKQGTVSQQKDNSNSTAEDINNTNKDKSKPDIIAQDTNELTSTQDSSEPAPNTPTNGIVIDYNDCEHCNKRFYTRNRLMIHIRRLVRKIDDVNRIARLQEALAKKRQKALEKKNQKKQKGEYFKFLC